MLDQSGPPIAWGSRTRASSAASSVLRLLAISLALSLGVSLLTPTHPADGTTRVAGPPCLTEDRPLFTADGFADLDRVLSVEDLSTSSKSSILYKVVRRLLQRGLIHGVPVRYVGAPPPDSPRRAAATIATPGDRSSLEVHVYDPAFEGSFGPVDQTSWLISILLHEAYHVQEIISEGRLDPEGHYAYIFEIEMAGVSQLHPSDIQHVWETALEVDERLASSTAPRVLRARDFVLEITQPDHDQPCLPCAALFEEAAQFPDGQLLITTRVGSSGSARQDFVVTPERVRLRMQMRFLSNEFPQYYGSQYNDAYVVALQTPQTNRVLATGNLNSSNWISSGEHGFIGAAEPVVIDLDLSPHVGTEVAIMLQVWDVGDDIVDSGILFSGLLPCGP